MGIERWRVISILGGGCTQTVTLRPGSGIGLGWCAECQLTRTPKSISPGFCHLPALCTYVQSARSLRTLATLHTASSHHPCACWDLPVNDCLTCLFTMHRHKWALTLNGGDGCGEGHRDKYRINRPSAGVTNAIIELAHNILQYFAISSSYQRVAMILTY